MHFVCLVSKQFRLCILNAQSHEECASQVAYGHQTDVVDFPASPALLIFTAGSCSFCELAKFCNFAKTTANLSFFFFSFLIEKAHRSSAEVSLGRTAKATGRSAHLGAGNRDWKSGIYKWDWSSTTQVHLVAAWT